MKKKASRLLKLRGRGKGKSRRKTATHLLQPVCIDLSTRSHSQQPSLQEHKGFQNKNSTLTFPVQMICCHQPTRLSKALSINLLSPCHLFFRISYSSKGSASVQGDHESCGCSEPPAAQAHCTSHNLYSAIQIPALRKHLLMDELDCSTGRTNTDQGKRTGSYTFFTLC